MRRLLEREEYRRLFEVLEQGPFTKEQETSLLALAIADDRAEQGIEFKRSLQTDRKRPMLDRHDLAMHAMLEGDVGEHFAHAISCPVCPAEDQRAAIGPALWVTFQPEDGGTLRMQCAYCGKHLMDIAVR